MTQNIIPLLPKTSVLPTHYYSDCKPSIFFLKKTRMGQGYVYDKATPQTLGVVFPPRRNYYVYFNNKVNKYKFECLYVNVISYMYNTSEILKLFKIKTNNDGKRSEKESSRNKTYEQFSSEILHWRLLSSSFKDCFSQTIIK